MAIDPRLLDEAGIVAYSGLPLGIRWLLLDLLWDERPDLRASVSGYMEMLSMEAMAVASVRAWLAR